MQRRLDKNRLLIVGLAVGWVGGGALILSGLENDHTVTIAGALLILSASIVFAADRIADVLKKKNE